MSSNLNMFLLLLTKRCINTYRIFLLSFIYILSFILLCILLPKKASTRQLTPLMALKKIWGSCFRHGCSTTSWGIPLELRNCSWNFGVVLTIAGLLRSTGLLKTNGKRRKYKDQSISLQMQLKPIGFIWYLILLWQNGWVLEHSPLSVVRWRHSCILMMFTFRSILK